MLTEQTHCSGASKPLPAVGVGRDGTALLDLMVGEPLAHVQGFSPKGHGAVWYGFELPDHQVRGAICGGAPQARLFRDEGE